MTIITDEERERLLDEQKADSVEGARNVTQPDVDSDDEREQQPPHGPPTPGPRLNQPPLSPLRQFPLLFLVVFLLLMAIAVQNHISRKKNQRQVISASRYSKVFKYRPAASPVITETLKDGRIRLEGASPRKEIVPTLTPKSKRRRTRRKCQEEQVSVSQGGVMEDGRLRLEGASPPKETVPTPTPKSKRRTRRRCQEEQVRVSQGGVMDAISSSVYELKDWIIARNRV